MRSSAFSICLHVFVALLFSVPLFAQQQLEVFMDQKRFATPDGKGVFEVYLQINASTAKLKRGDDQLLTSKVEITEIIRRGDSIVDFRKSVLESPAMADTMIADFMDQKRFFLDPGQYILEISVLDIYRDSSRAINAALPFEIPVTRGHITFSDIQQIEGFSKATAQGPLTKAGNNLIPFVSNYYAPDIEKLAYYFEIYNTHLLGAEEKFLLMQFIREKKTGKQLDAFTKISRQTAKETIPVLTVFDISKLESGSYELTLEIRNKNNELLATQVFDFQRNNPDREYHTGDLSLIDIKATFVERIVNRDTLSEYIACLRPIALPAEIGMIDTLVLSGDEQMRKQFFYYFWKNRDPQNPEESWLRYSQTVNYVNRIFGTSIKKGYQTDRGVVFLKYGAPDWVMDRPNEPSSYPYQIWQYKKLGQFNNKRYIFYMPDLVTNDYVTLHSDVPGEVRNHRWQQILNARNSPNIDMDNPNGGNNPHWGGNSNEFFRNPR